MAADVSPSQNVEMLNQGLWVFNKSGNVQGGPEPLYQLWCGSVGANGQYLPPCPAAGNENPLELVDTQIAFDPFDSRWLATTLAINPVEKTGDLLFAVSTSTSAIDGTGAWERYDIPVCTSGTNLFPDQPILGYSSDWVAADVLCADPAGNFGDGTDSLLLIPNASIVNPPQALNANSQIINPPLFASRPSRDVSASGYSQLILASARFNPNAPPNVALYGIGASPSPTPVGNSPDIWGFSGTGSDQMPDAPQPGCTVETSNCMINVIDQSRIQQVTLQYDPANGRHYLLTSVAAGYQSGAEIIYFIGELETGNWDGEFTGAGNTGWVPAYTTITADQDLDISATETSFISNGFPYSIGFAWHGFQGPGQPTGPAEVAFANSAGIFTGQNTCPTPTPTGNASPTAR